MGGKVKRIGRYSVILFITLLAWSIGLSYTQSIQELRNTMELRYIENGPSLEKVKKIIRSEKENPKSNINSIVAWKQEYSEEVKNLSLGSNVQVDVLKVYGDGESLNFLKKIVGESIGIGKKDEVLITQEIAYKLWGSEDVVGKKLSYKDKEYIVKGIIEDEGLLLVIPVNQDEEEILFEGLRFQFRENENLKEDMQRLQSQYGLSEGVIVDLSLISSLVGQLMLIPSWGLGILILMKFYKVVCKSYHYWIACIFLAIIGIGMTGLVIDVMQFQVEIPSTWVPNKWSDFEFWSRLVTGLQEEWLGNKSLPLSVLDLWMQEVIRGINIALISVGIGFIVLIRRVELKDWDTIFWKSLIGVLLTFAALLTNYWLGNEVVTIKALWIMWPIYMSVEYLLYTWKKCFKI